MRRQQRRMVWGAFVALLGGSLAGCGADDGRVEVHRVSGKVLLAGEPAAGAVIVLHSLLPPAEQKGQPIPRGVADEAGEFVVTSYEPGDGAPAGAYLVSVTWPEAVAAGGDPESGGDPGDRLDGRYANPEMSGLRVTIEEGPNQLEAFALQ